MKIQITFNYQPNNYIGSIPFRITIDENKVDMSHYDDLWDFWFGENENELLPHNLPYVDEEVEREFEIIADKVFPNDSDGIISGKNIEINVYEKGEDFAYLTIDKEVIDVKYL